MHQKSTRTCEQNNICLHIYLYVQCAQCGAVHRAFEIFQRALALVPAREHEPFIQLARIGGYVHGAVVVDATAVLYGFFDYCRYCLSMVLLLLLVPMLLSTTFYRAKLEIYYMHALHRVPLHD